MTDCQHCGKPASGTLCTKCTADYWAMIYQLGHIQLPTLRSIMLRQAHIGTTDHTPNKGNAPLPIDVHAQDLIAESEAWLAEQAGKIRAAYAAYDWRKAWYAIISNKHTILTMSTAADDYAQQVRDNLEAQTKVIEGNIQGLKQFETEYRARLTEFLGQLVSQVSDTNNYDQDSQDD